MCIHHIYYSVCPDCGTQFQSRQFCSPPCWLAMKITPNGKAICLEVCSQVNDNTYERKDPDVPEQLCSRCQLRDRSATQ